MENSSSPLVDIRLGPVSFDAGMAEKRRQRQRAARLKYERTPRGLYVKHKKNARRRGVAFFLTFDEWWQIWQASRRWNQRGSGKGKYNMLRLRDVGPYAIGNVRIGRHETNVRERNRTWRKIKFGPNSKTVLFEE